MTGWIFFFFYYFLSCALALSQPASHFKLRPFEQLCKLSLQGCLVVFFVSFLVFLPFLDKQQLQGLDHAYVPPCTLFIKTTTRKRSYTEHIHSDHGEKQLNTLPPQSLLLYVCVGMLSLSLPLIPCSSTAASTAPSVFFFLIFPPSVLPTLPPP